MTCTYFFSHRGYRIVWDLVRRQFTILHGRTEVGNAHDRWDAMDRIDALIDG